MKEKLGTLAFFWKIRLNVFHGGTDTDVTQGQSTHINPATPQSPMCEPLLAIPFKITISAGSTKGHRVWGHTCCSQAFPTTAQHFGNVLLWNQSSSVCTGRTISSNRDIFP